MKTLIVGLGEVGKAMLQILSEYCPVGIDVENNNHLDHFEILHICIPYSNTFIEEVKRYQNIVQPTYTIIHSTVPLGASRACNAVHSPIRGIHPNLFEGIKTFPKFIGGEHASDVADYFRRAGLKVILCDTQEATELGKLLDTEYYRSCIEFAKRAKELCDKNNLNFHEVYTLFNTTYNEGYTALGHAEYVRPVLQPIMKPIGGHCILENTKMLERVK